MIRKFNWFHTLLACAGVFGIAASAQATPIVPNALGGLQLWFDATDLNADGIANNPADGSAVSQWRDKSGNSRHANQATANKQPSFNSTAFVFPVVRFSNVGMVNNDLSASTADFLSIAGTPQLWDNTNGLTIISVVRGGATQEILSQYNGGPNQRFFRDQTNAANIYSNPTNPASITTASNTAPATLTILSTDWIPSATSLARYTNGTLAATTSVSAGINSTSPQTVSEAVLIGAQGGGTFNNLGGDLAELIVFNRGLNASERRGVEQYLGQKYGITVVPEPSSACLLLVGMLAVFRRKLRLTR